MRTMLLLAALLGAAPALAQPGDKDQPGLGDPLRALDEQALLEELPKAPAIEVEPRQKFLFGDDGYRSDDTDVFLLLPLGFSADLDYSGYESDTSTRTHTLSFGGGKEWDSRFLGVTYTITPWANDYRADSFDVKASIRSGPRDWRTTLGADVNVTHHVQVIRLPNRPGNRVEITQRTPTISIRQQLKRTRLTGDFSQSSYNKDLTIASLDLAVATVRYPGVAANFGNSSGLVQGFQDWSARYGVSQDVELGSRLLTGWFTYENIHFVDTFQSPDGVAVVFERHQTADGLRFGLDAELTERLTGSLQYQRVRQTNLPTRDYWGFALGYRL